MRNRVWRGLLVGALMVGTLGACGDDDDDTVAPAPDGAGESGENALEIEMIDYGYKVSGKLRPGLATITSRNTGDEFHMAGFGKLKPGKTVAELTKALEAAAEGGGGGPEGGGGAPEGGGGSRPEGGQQGAGEIKAASVSQEGEGEGGGGGDPTAEFIEKQLGTPGHILQPGQSQSITTDVLEEGSYVMLCFIPTEGEGTPHFAKGMVAGFEVGKGESKAEEPEADETITLGDDAEPTGVPTDLKAGEHTFKVTSSGSKSKDFIVASLKEGKEFDDFDKFFIAEFEKEDGPAKGAAKRAPGTIYANTFALEPGESLWVTVNIPSGETYFVSATNTEGSDDTVDKFVKVNVT